ncbi:MAG: pyrroline-5-carboxylate reductase [Bacteroidetes bacterium]|nr:pyrroline-5-carboxylate reductase [Bacteroidota bacterium]
MQDTKIAIIGGGNLGTAILKGLVYTKQYTKEEILVSEKKKHRINYLNENGFQVISDNLQAVKSANTIIISVKPQQITELLEEIKPELSGNSKILLTTVTGFTFSQYEKIIGQVPIFRIMPNTAIEIGESMTCISHIHSTKEQEDKVIALLEKLGKTMIIDEDQLASATVLGACGIGFALRFIRSMSQGGIEIGFGSEVSQYISAQTIKGAAELILQSGNHPEREIDKVTTPQGITISGLNEMEHQGFSSAVIKGLLASYNKLELVRNKEKK